MAADEDEDMEVTRAIVVATAVDVAATRAQIVVDVEAAATKVAEVHFPEDVVALTRTSPCPRPASTRTWSPKS